MASQNTTTSAAYPLHMRNAKAASANKPKKATLDTPCALLVLSSASNSPFVDGPDDGVEGVADGLAVALGAGAGLAVELGAGASVMGSRSKHSILKYDPSAACEQLSS